MAKKGGGRKIVLGGSEYEILYDDKFLIARGGDDSFIWGYYQPETHKIIIRKKGAQGDEVSTGEKHAALIHEVIHWIIDKFSVSLPNGENDVDRLSQGIYDFIRQNPAIVKAIIEDKEI